MKTIKLTTREIYNNFMASVEDIIWEEGSVSSHIDEINKIASPNIDDIRLMFKNGYTTMMVGNKMKEIESWSDVAGKIVKETDEIEIRVYGWNAETNRYTTLLGVIIDSEINY